MHPEMREPPTLRCLPRTLPSLELVPLSLASERGRLTEKAEKSLLQYQKERQLGVCMLREIIYSVLRQNALSTILS